jgi:hypothetical protein
MALLRIMRHVDLLEGRFAAACGCGQPGQRAAAAALAKELAALEAAVAPQAAGAPAPYPTLYPGARPPGAPARPAPPPGRRPPRPRWLGRWPRAPLGGRRRTPSVPCAC